ncbi:hypothetical protein SAMD00079811_26490 [Scytonema sp. HK-05]|uniref:hypothetical protein n=1 Tax=Scytonema sp. HK-05 TaxID=1137095 RepID=UPI000936D599|nr:hypothetical protein [Scytonema sp. HK-05]OKH60755.1 hypothetical protein NIES2130_01300 [Scytonema sp. HK-05]BAY45047.1 hypothetical protein SAMD00079811_26490 [Scytonema sp. HK-05]
MKRVFSTAVTMLVSFALPTTAEAAIINGGFENALENWQTLGESRFETSAFGSPTVEGNFQAFLSTAFNEVVGVDGNGKEIRGGNAAPATYITGIAENSLEGFLGVSQFFGDDFLAEAIEGSAIKQTFTANAGQTLSFSWNFLTNESVGNDANPDFNDFAFATLSDNSQNLFFRLADTTTTFLANGSNTNFFEETGLKTFSYTLPTDGEYTLGIGVVDVGEPTVISGLLIDGVGVQAIPETSSTVGFLLLGAVGAVSVLKRSRRKTLNGYVERGVSSN